MLLFKNWLLSNIELKYGFYEKGLSKMEQPFFLYIIVVQRTKVFQKSLNGNGKT